MRYLVNVGTEKGKVSAPDMGHDARGLAIRKWIEDNCELYGWEYYTDKASESTVVMDVKIVRVGKRVVHLFYDLAEATQQDCVAVWDCAQGKGELIGPRASLWRPFDATKFKWSPVRSEAWAIH